MMTEPTKGVVAMVAACTIWGMGTLFYDLIAHVPPLEVLCHRTTWSLVFFGCILIFQRRMTEVWSLFREPKSCFVVVFAALMISVNWFLFIYSIQKVQTIQSSLGYYIFPLAAVLMGFVLFGERLSKPKLFAVSLAALAVLVLTIGLGVAPWISLILAFTFGLYGVMKKMSGARPIVSVTAEVLILSPLAIVWLAGVHLYGWGGAQGQISGAFLGNWRDSLVLIASGPITAVPLVLLSYASKRITMASVGVVQYLNPSLQFVFAVMFFEEVLTPSHAIAFPMIWLALAIYSAEAIRQERAARRASQSSVTVETTVT